MITTQILDGHKTVTNIDGRFDIATDQPLPQGEDTAPSPFDFFLMAIAACTAYFVQRYCRKWNLPHAGISVDLEPVFSPQHTLTDVKIKIRLPTGFPAEHHAGVMRNAAACPVKKALESPPAIAVELVAA